MKIRNGFVSNSSSSSFILVYDKTKVISDPQEIVNYVTENPNTEPIFYGVSLGEGDDVFTLTSEQESLIRKFPEDFKLTSRITLPKLYCNGKLTRNAENEYWDIDKYVDMSDMKEEVEITSADINNYYSKNPSPDVLEKFRLSNEYLTLKNKRISKFYKEKNSEKVKILINSLIAEGSDSKDIDNKEIYIDNCSTEYYDEDFISTYLSEDSSDPNSYLLDNRANHSFPYIVLYDKLLSDKEEITKYLKSLVTIEDFKPFMFWSNPPMNYNNSKDLFDSEGVNIDFYEIGEEERDFVINHYRDTNRKYFLATEAKVITNSNETINSNSRYLHVLLGYGKPAVIKAGTDMVDFKRNFKE